MFTEGTRVTDGFKRESIYTPRTQAQVLYWSETEDPVRQLKHTVLRSCARFYTKSNDRGVQCPVATGEGKSRFHGKTLRSFCICITMTVSYLLRKGWCCEPRFRGCTIRVKCQPLQVQVEKLGKGIEGRDDMKKFYPRPYTTQADIRMATATVKRRIV